MTSNNNTGAIAPGAAGVGASNTPGTNPMALKTEMNKVDVIVDGRSVAGMYQVVHHRYETISTTTAVVPRSADDPHHHQVGTALHTFLSAGSSKAILGRAIFAQESIFFALNLFAR